MGVYNLSGNVEEQEVKEQKIDNTESVDNNNNTVITDNKKEEVKEQKTVTLYGPLSNIYTAALNLTYANESTYIMMPPFSEDNKEEDSVGDLFVYCCDSKNLTSNELVEGTNKLRLALDNKKYKKVMAVLECSDIDNNRIGLFDTFSRSLGIEMFVSRKSAINKIKSYL